MRPRQALTAVAALIVAGCLWYWAGEFFTLARLQGEGERLQRFVAMRPVVAGAGFCLLYATTALFLPGALVLTLAAGYLFGAVTGGFLVIISGTIGATASFLLAKSVL